MVKYVLQTVDAGQTQSETEAAQPLLLYGEKKGVESPPPPRPAKSVGFTKNPANSSTPPLQKRNKPPGERRVFFYFIQSPGLRCTVVEISNMTTSYQFEII